MVRQTTQSGFTLIEMIVSLGVFSVVMTTAVGALLMLVATNEQLQGEQSIMTNLSFALDSMTREIRTGTNYFCDARNEDSSVNNIFNVGRDLDVVFLSTGTRDCDSSFNRDRIFHGLSFTEAGNSITAGAARIAYFYDRDEGRLFRRVGAGDKVSIIASGIHIHKAEFYVTGSKPVSEGPPNHDDQASVTILITASEDASTPAEEQVTLQTTISQRTLDI